MLEGRGHHPSDLDRLRQELEVGPLATQIGLLRLLRVVLLKARDAQRSWSRLPKIHTDVSGSPALTVIATYTLNTGAVVRRP